MIAEPRSTLEPALTERPRRLIGISLVPAAATLGNLLCGFLAVFCCLLSIRAEYGSIIGFPPRVFHVRMEQLFPTHIAAGAYLIILAMIFDALDGRLARITRRTSEFGAQLDSLSDVVSFGVAPAALFIALLLRPVAGSPADGFEALRVQRGIGILCALIYVSCAAIRLARYNAENVKGEAAQHRFSGLPSPGAAAVLVALLALHEDLRHSGFSAWGIDWLNILRWVIAGAAVAAGILMVSRLDYVHVFNVYARRKQPPTHLLWLVAIIGFGWYISFELLLVTLAFAYVISGLGLHFLHRGRAHPTSADTPAH